MLTENREIPIILKFGIAVGLLEIFFCSSWPRWCGIPQPFLVPIFGFLVIVAILWLIYGERRARKQSDEPAE